MFITILYAVQNFQLMLGYKNTQFSTSTDVSYHDSSYIFTEEKGFQLAFGILDVGNYENDFEEFLEVKVIQNNFVAELD